MLLLDNTNSPNRKIRSSSSIISSSNDTDSNNSLYKEIGTASETISSMLNNVRLDPPSSSNMITNQSASSICRKSTKSEKSINPSMQALAGSIR